MSNATDEAVPAEVADMGEWRLEATESNETVTATLL